MPRFQISFFSLIIIGLVLASCGRSNTLADKSPIQKRRYQKGFHVDIKSPFDKGTTEKKSFANSGSENPAEATEEFRPEPESEGVAVLNQTDSIKVAGQDSITASKVDETLSASIDGDQLVQADQTVIDWNERVQPERVESSEPDYYKDTGGRRLNVLALLGFIFAILGLFFAGIILGLAAVIMCSIALGKMNRYPALYSGRGLAIAGLVIGIVAIIGAIVVISMM